MIAAQLYYAKESVVPSCSNACFRLPFMKLPLHVDADVKLSWLVVVPAVVDMVSSPPSVAGHMNDGLNGGTSGGGMGPSRICRMAGVLGRSAGVGWLHASPSRISRST